MAAEARPLPSDETTPPVTKMYFGATSPLLRARSPAHPGPPRAGSQPDVSHRRRAAPHRAVEPPVAQLVQDPGPRGIPHATTSSPLSHGRTAASRVAKRVSR